MNAPAATACAAIALLSVSCSLLPTGGRPGALTPSGLADLAPAPAHPTARAPRGKAKKTFIVELSGLSEPAAANAGDPFSEKPGLANLRVALSGEAQGVLELAREFVYPTEMIPPSAGGDSFGVTPATPAAFGSVKLGWTIRVKAKAHGGLIALSGVADHVSCRLQSAGYGFASRPIYTEAGALLSKNEIKLPRFETKTTHFQLFVVPGETCEVLLDEGTKRRKCLLKVSAD